MLMRSGKVSGGKPLNKSYLEVERNDHRLHKRCLRLIGVSKGVTFSPPIWRGKGADRRTTNRVGLVKVTQMYSGMSGECEGRPAVLSGKPEISGVVMGTSTQRPCRDKSGRYALKQLSGNWRGLNRSHLSKEGYKACRLKLFPKPIKKSEMFIVALIQKISKTFWSEGTLAWTCLFWAKGYTIARRGLNTCFKKVCVTQKRLTNPAKSITIGRMLGRGGQGESRVRENRTHGLVYEVMGKRNFSPAFTLIERVSRKGLGGVV